eukprot:8056375-Pyramimonas_sp.AAC.1
MECPTTASRARRSEREGLRALGQCKFLLWFVLSPRGGVAQWAVRLAPWRGPSVAAAVAGAAELIGCAAAGAGTGIGASRASAVGMPRHLGPRRRPEARRSP